MKADLHCHSTASDGTLSPEELLLLAKKEGLFGLSITDHDTIEGYKTAGLAAKKNGVLLGSGVEFSCEHNGSSIHILGYDYDLKDPGIEDLCKRHQERRQQRNHAILEKLAKVGLILDEKELLALADHKTVGRPHIAQQMVNRGYVRSLQEAFNKYLGDGKPCYASGISFSIRETITILHNARGKAFLAHPHLLPKKIPLQDLLALPLDGIECFYARFGQKEASCWLKIAQDKKWLISGGSDFPSSNCIT